MKIRDLVVVSLVVAFAAFLIRGHVDGSAPANRTPPAKVDWHDVTIEGFSAGVGGRE